jgi:excisionase family DNA binding protein
MAGLAAPPRWLTVKEVARVLDLHEITVRRKVAAGVIQALQLGGRGCALRVMEDELSSWLEEHRNVGSSPPSGDEEPQLERRAPDSGQSTARALSGEAA